MHACFREIRPPSELFTSRLHVKGPSLTDQGVSQAKFRKRVESFGMIKDAMKIVKNRGRKRNPHDPSNPLSARLVV